MGFFNPNQRGAKIPLGNNTFNYTAYGAASVSWEFYAFNPDKTLKAITYVVSPFPSIDIISITSYSPTKVKIVTASPHGFTDGDRIQLRGIDSYYNNGAYFASLTDATSFVINKVYQIPANLGKAMLYEQPMIFNVNVDIYAEYYQLIVREFYHADFTGSGAIDTNTLYPLGEAPAEQQPPPPPSISINAINACKDATDTNFGVSGVSYVANVTIDYTLETVDAFGVPIATVDSGNFTAQVYNNIFTQTFNTIPMTDGTDYKLTVVLDDTPTATKSIFFTTCPAVIPPPVNPIVLEIETEIEADCESKITDNTTYGDGIVTPDRSQSLVNFVVLLKGVGGDTNVTPSYDESTVTDLTLPSGDGIYNVTMTITDAPSWVGLPFTYVEEKTFVNTCKLENCARKKDCCSCCEKSITEQINNYIFASNNYTSITNGALAIEKATLICEQNECC